MTFLRWCEEVLIERFSDQAWPIDESASQFATTDIEFNQNGWAAFSCSLNGEVIWRIPLGWLDRKTLALPMPSDLQMIRVLRKTIEMFEQWARLHLKHAFDQDPQRKTAITSDEYPLLMMLEDNLKFGTPSPVPVPKPGLLSLKSTARDLRIASSEIRSNAVARLLDTYLKPVEVLAVFQLKNWVIVLADDTNSGLYSEAAIFILDASATSAAQVFKKIGEETGATIDGDVFSLRRFLQLLVGAIREAGLDKRIVFTAGTQLMLTEWLSFNIPEEEEDLLFNWKLQSYAASAGVSFPETVLTERAEKMWREFLNDIVDPRLQDPVL